MSFLKKITGHYKVTAKEKRFFYVVDMNERGTFSCHVENSNGKIVWSASTDDSEDGQFWPVEDGFMDNTEDTIGLEKYLKSIHLMPSDAGLYDQDQMD